MEFRLLGLLEVSDDDGHLIGIVRGHESGLLALLLLHANQALSAERIVEELWAGTPPENARKSVHIYISRLRKALGPSRIETTPAGYLLHVAAEELDVAHFESLAIEGRAALDRGAAADAEHVFDRALALWRVAPLADYRFEAFAAAETRRLEELHAAVLADRVDARIACGRPNLVIEELEALIERSPLWERPRAQLMRALYLMGRQADALELYRDTRTLLNDELGVEPGPELQRLEQQVLNQDPDLGEPTPPPRPVVRQRRFQFAAVLACGLVAAVVYAALAFPRGGALSSTRPNVSNPTSAVSAIDPRTNRVVSTTAVGRYPSRIAADRNALWVINAQDETISRIDPRTRSVVHTFAPGSTPTDLLPFANAVWVATPLRNRVLRLDESTDEVTAQIFAPNPLFLDSARGKLWVVGETVQTFDPATRKRTLVFDRSFPDSQPAADANFGSIVVLGRRLFISSAGMAVTNIAGRGVDPGMAVTRIDASTRAVRQSKEFGGQGGDSARITTAKGSLWLTSPDLDRLLQVNPGSLEVIRKIAVGERPVGVSFGASSLWVANSNDGTVMRIDPANGRVLATIRVGGTPFDLTFAHQLAWVTIL